jgi:hypothetical protein
MRPASYSIELVVSRKPDSPRYVARILAARPGGLSVALEERFNRLEALTDWVEEHIDAWC